jgi:hypothetical protein
MNFCSKLECLSLVSLANLVQYLRLRLRAYPIMGHMEGAFLRLAPCLTCKHWYRLEKLASEKHTSLL